MRPGRVVAAHREPAWGRPVGRDADDPIRQDDREGATRGQTQQRPERFTPHGRRTLVPRDAASEAFEPFLGTSDATGAHGVLSGAVLRGPVVRPAARLSRR